MSRSTERVELHCCLCGDLICVTTEEALLRSLPPVLCDPCRGEPYRYSFPDLCINLGEPGQTDPGEDPPDG